VLGIFQDVTDMVRLQRRDVTSKEAYEKARSTGLIYTHIAKALARGYTYLYYVNLDSEEFVQYRTQDEGGILTEARRGWHFFEEAGLTAERLVHPDDLAAVLKAIDRRTLVDVLERDKLFVITFRYASERGSIYVSMRISRMEDDDRFIVIGITDIDNEMKQRRFAERMQEEQIAYARLNALTGVFLCVYIVDPKSDRYREFSSTAGYGMLSQEKEGRDFFATVREAAVRINHPDDLNRFLAAFTKERVMAEIEANGIFTLSYRIILEGRPVYVQLKAAIVEEKDRARMIVGINDIDSQVRQEEEYLEHLARARIEANVDALTGVKNRHAYLMAEERLNVQISEGHDPEYAVVILDVNDLKTVNDTMGHNAGDQYLKDACRIVCNIFKHSPVFRIGGDEFAVIAQGGDYECIDELVERVRDQNMEAMNTGGIVIACGMAKSEHDSSVALVFERADQNMYENKNRLKTEKNERQL
jgi:diguanylate cyclase (GGDEF)-like protein